MIVEPRRMSGLRAASGFKRIVLSSRGSRGDVHPIIEIAAELHRQGHQVRVCVPALFEPEVRRRGLPVSVLKEDSEETMARMGAGLRAGWEALRWFSSNLSEHITLLLRETAHCDVLVTSVNEPAATTVAEYRGIPHFRVAYAPIIPGSQPPPLIPWQGLPPMANRVLWRGVTGTSGVFVRSELERWRRALGLGPMGHMEEYFAGRSRTLLTINRLLAPPAGDWRYDFEYTGYCHGPDPAAPPPDDDLRAFLDAGSPPVYIGFGSVSLPHPRRFTALILDGVRRAGCRVILAAGWTGLGSVDLPDTVYSVGEVDHAALFERVAGVAHHGGSGTVHTALRAGIPQFVMPQIVDQFYWGKRLFEMGLGPRPVSPKRLTAKALARAVRDLAHNRLFADQASHMADQVRGEDGTGRAAEIIINS